jgi:hypothetical protein
MVFFSPGAAMSSLVGNPLWSDILSDSEPEVADLVSS